MFGAAIILVAQTEHITAFTGTWSLNLAKSQFDPGPAFKDFTIRFARDGTRNLDLVDADGQKLKISLPWSDGKEVHPTGMENATAISKIQGRTFHDIWKQNGRTIENVPGALSSNGKSLTIFVDAMYQEGHRIQNRLTFEKQ